MFFETTTSNWFIVSQPTEVLGHSAISNSEFSSLEGALGLYENENVRLWGIFGGLNASLLLRELEIWMGEDVLPEITWFHEGFPL